MITTSNSPPRSAGVDFSRRGMRLRSDARPCATAMAGKVVATPAAIRVIMGLRAAHHTVALRQCGESLEGDLPTRIEEAKLPRRINDLQLGQVGGIPFLIDGDRYRDWGCPDVVVDVARSGSGRPLAGKGGEPRLVVRGEISPVWFDPRADRDGSLSP